MTIKTWRERVFISPSTIIEVAMQSEIDELRAALATAGADLDAALREKNEAYRQRNVLVAYIARLFPSGIRRTNIEGWSADWHGCVYVDLPTGQISYHYHDSHAYLFSGLSAYTKEWDGHDKETVENRIYDAALAAEEEKHECF